MIVEISMEERREEVIPIPGSEVFAKVGRVNVYVILFKFR